MLKKLMKVAAGPALLLTPVAVTAADRPAGVMYKNPGCACCDGHAEALRRAGIDLRVVASENPPARKAPAALHSRVALRFRSDAIRWKGMSRDQRLRGWPSRNPPLHGSSRREG